MRYTVVCRKSIIKHTVLPDSVEDVQGKRIGPFEEPKKSYQVSL